jgi:hypothetical protein
MIRGRKRPLEKVPEVKANLNCSIHNRFDIEVIDTATGEIKQKAQAENVICNQLWTRLFTPNTYFNYIHYGTGNGTPSATDTSLFAFLGYGSPVAGDDVYSTDLLNGVFSLRRKIQLAETVAVGETLTEVGVGHGTGSATLCTHAMLKDMNGNPISIAKTATDVINIYATVFAHCDSTYFDHGAITLTGPTNSRNLLFKWIFGLGSPVGSGATVYPGFYYNVKTGCGVSRTNGILPTKTLATLSFSLAAKTFTLVLTRLGVNDSNYIGGIHELAWCPATNYGYSTEYYTDFLIRPDSDWYSPNLIEGEAIGTGDGETTDFATDFPIRSDARIYVNGVEQLSGVSVDINTPISITDVGKQFRFLPKYSYICTDADQVHCIPHGFGDTYKETKHESVWYNPFYSLGLVSYNGISSASVLQASDDLSTWVAIGSGSGVKAIASAYKNYKYWKISGDDCAAFTTDYTGNNIHFDTAPVSGAVITADYKPDTIAKDANHVFDLTVTIQLGEKTT